jgi:hypothetical protein
VERNHQLWIVEKLPKNSKMTGGIKLAQQEVIIILNIQIKKGKVTLPHPKKDIPIKTLISIEKQAGIKLR